MEDTINDEEQAVLEEGFNYETVDEAPQDCICILCEFLVRDARQTECCGRIMCNYCIQKYKKSVMTFRCPNCRSPLQGKYFKDLRTDRAVQMLVIYCTRKDQGCGWEGKMEDLETHIRDECGLTTTQCPACSEGDIKRKYLENHMENTCSKRHYFCPHCNTPGAYDYIITDHLKECPQAPLPCPVQGCTQRVKRSNLNEHLQTCSQLVLHCPNQSQGCNIRMRREDQEQHCQICPKRHHVCPYCKLEGTHDFITTKHTIECQEILIICHTPQCKEKVKRSEMKQHVQVCPKMIVQCSYASLGCRMEIKRDELEKHEEKLVKQHLKLAMNRIQELEYKSQPTVVKLTNVSEYQQTDMDWLSPAFYSSIDGYKARLRVFVNGKDDAKGKYLSIFVILIPGRNDDTVEWPFQGEVKMELLNQITDSNHLSVTTIFDEKTPDKMKDRKHKIDTNGCGMNKFISVKELNCPVYNNTQYLVNDMLYFRVTFQPASLTKPWLACPLDSNY